MAGATMTGAELGGRLIAVEAFIIAIASEFLATLPDDRAEVVFEAVSAIATATMEDLLPVLAPRDKVSKDMEQAAKDYVAAQLDRARRIRAKLQRDGALTPSK